MQSAGKPATIKRPGKVARAVMRALAAVLLVLALALCALWWWTGTEGSLASSLRWARTWVPLTFSPLTTEHATGSLRSGGHIDRLVWQQGDLKIEATDLTLAWQPWALLSGILKIERISATAIVIDDQRPADTQASTGPPDSLVLPLRIALDTFSVAHLRWAGALPFSASGISGKYGFDGQQHAVDLTHAQVDSGTYQGSASLSAHTPLSLDARLSGTVSAALPGSKNALPLTFSAKARGPVTALLVDAFLQLPPAASGTTKTATVIPSTQPGASITARITPWAVQPVAQADAVFRDLDVAAVWPDAPHTLLTGSASVKPANTATTSADTSLAAQAWALQLDLANRLAGPWDQHRLPLERLNTTGEWHAGTGIIRSLKAQLGSGELLASGEWASANVEAGTPTTSKPWKLQATLQHINPAALHTGFAALPLDGRASLQGHAAFVAFEASLEALGSGKQPARNALQQLSLRDADARGSWNGNQAGGTLVLSSLRIRTEEAELSGQADIQPSSRGGKGNLTLNAPGLAAQVQGDLHAGSGKGEFAVQGKDIAQAVRWLQKLPFMPPAVLDVLQTHTASGNAELNGSWQGGWLDPALQARLAVPSLDWNNNGTATATGAIKLRAAQATLSGRLSQMQLAAQGRVEHDARRYFVQLATDAGRNASIWQGVLRQLEVSVEDPALSARAWKLATRGTVALQWASTTAGGAFESGAGEAVLTAPRPTDGRATGAAASTALLSWQPVRWRPGELTTAGKISGLPLAWIELLAGPQMAGTSLSGNMVFEGQWDARLADTLALKARLTRSSGDISVQAEGAQGTAVRVAAGVRQASLAIASTGDALDLTLRWDSERAGSLDGQFKTRLARAPAGAGGADSWIWPADAPLTGQLRAQLPRIGVWSVLAPPGWRLRGSLGANIAISGTRGNPQLTGDLQANDLALRSVVDGIELGNGRLRATLDGTRMRISEFTLQGAGDKGTGGTLTAQGEAAWVNGQPVVQLDARLERLRASLRSDRQVTLSGTLRARLDGVSTEFSGALKVDQARIILPEEGTPQLGDDVVVRGNAGIAAGKKAPAETTTATAAAAQSKRTLKVAVQLDLGQDFRVQGKGIDTLMRGTLALSGNALADARLVGTVTTSGGQYRAYGQRLDIEQGVLRFTGALDNPSLDILAIRPNLTQRVGVQITGTALLPRIRLYAEPELPDAEKLSWLIVGRASATGGAEAALLQQAAIALLGSKGGMSGGLAASLGLDELSYRGASSNADGTTAEGAVTLGKRFSRNFYAAYERSISGALGTLYVFYDLSRRFTVRGQAGQQSAVDLIFTVPYD